MFPLLAWATVTLVCGMLSLYLYRIEVILAINRILGRHKKPVTGIARPAKFTVSVGQATGTTTSPTRWHSALVRDTFKSAIILIIVWFVLVVVIPTLVYLYMPAFHHIFFGIMYRVSGAMFLTMAIFGALFGGRKYWFQIGVVFAIGAMMLGMEDLMVSYYGAPQE